MLMPCFLWTNKAFWIGLFIVVISFGCTPAKYLPTTKNMPTNPYGSYIKVIVKNSTDQTFWIKGELIAVMPNEVVIYDIHQQKIISAKKEEINHFEILFARPKNYAWAPTVLIIISITTHGYFSTFSTPANLLAGALIANWGYRHTSTNSRRITYAELKNFARFPQGIPPGINWDDIAPPVDLN